MMIEPLVASYGTDQYSLPVSGSTEVTAFRPHEDELPLAAGFDDRGRRVALLGRRERVPDFLARFLLKATA